MANQAENIQENIYSDKFDTDLVSNLSLFLFEEKYILLAKDANQEISAIHQKFFADYNSLSFVLQRDKLYQLPLPTKVFLFNQEFALIPGLIFDSSKLSNYLQFAKDQASDNREFFSSLDSNNLYIVGAIQKNLLDVLSKKGFGIDLHHGAVSFLAYLLKDKSTYLNQEVFISIYGRKSYIAAFKNQKLVNFNSYEIEDKDALLKYVFGTIGQLNFDRKYCRVTLFGEYDALDFDQEFGGLYFKNFILDQPKSNQQYLSGAQIFQNSNLFEAYWEFK